MKTKVRSAGKRSPFAIRAQSANPQSSLRRAGETAQNEIPLDILSSSFLVKTHSDLAARAARATGDERAALLSIVSSIQAELDKRQYKAPCNAAQPPSLSETDLEHVSRYISGLDEHLDRSHAFITSLLSTLLDWRKNGEPSDEQFERILNGWTLFGMDLDHSLSTIHNELFEKWHGCVRPGTAHLIRASGAS